MQYSFIPTFLIADVGVFYDGSSFYKNIAIAEFWIRKIYSSKQSINQSILLHEF